MRPQPIFAIFICLLLFGCQIESVNRPHQINQSLEPTPVPTSVPISKQSYTVQSGTVIQRIELTGQVRPATETEHFFEQPGIVAEVFVSIGDQVEEGDLLAALDMTQLTTELKIAETENNSAEAALSSAQQAVDANKREAEINLERAQLELAYLQTALPEQPTAKQTADIQLKMLDVELAEIALSETNIAIDPGLEAAVIKSRLEIERISALIEQSTLTAKSNGTVIWLNIEPSQTISAEGEDAALIIGDLSDLDIQAQILATEIELFLQGMEGSGALVTSPRETFPITLYNVPLEDSEISAQSTIRFKPQNEAVNLEVNDQILINLDIGISEDTLWLPSAAIRDFGGRKLVVLQNGGAQQQVIIKIGLENEDQVEVLEGLSLGDTVIGP